MYGRYRREDDLFDCDEHWHKYSSDLWDRSFLQGLIKVRKRSESRRGETLQYCILVLQLNIFEVSLVENVFLWWRRLLLKDEFDVIAKNSVEIASIKLATNWSVIRALSSGIMRNIVLEIQYLEFECTWNVNYRLFDFKHKLVRRYHFHL